MLKPQVYPGAAKPLIRPQKVCEEIHGESGLDGEITTRLLERALDTQNLLPSAAAVREDAGAHHSRVPLAAGPELPSPRKSQSEGPAVHAMYQALAAPSPVMPVLVCTGADARPHPSHACASPPFASDPATIAAKCMLRRSPLPPAGALTNAALLFSVYPELVGRVRVALMGGALGVGNTGPVAEFNLQLDPEAASVVFTCGVEIAMVPLEVTHTALVTQEVLDRIGDGTEFRRLVKELLLFFRDSYKSHFNFDDPPLHDPCAVACAQGDARSSLPARLGPFSRPYEERKRKAEMSAPCSTHAQVCLRAAYLRGEEVQGGH